MDSSVFFNWANSLIENLGYTGIFLVNLVGSATIFFPLPAAAIVFVFGAFFNPLLIAIFASIGGTLGELVGYSLGVGGGKLLEKKYEKFLKKGEQWFEPNRGFFYIILFAATPLPDDVVGILGGLFKYNVKKFILASFIGKMIMNSALAFGGAYGLNWILNIFKLGF